MITAVSLHNNRNTLWLNLSFSIVLHCAVLILYFIAQPDKQTINLSMIYSVELVSFTSDISGLNNKSLAKNNSSKSGIIELGQTEKTKRISLGKNRGSLKNEKLKENSIAAPVFLNQKKTGDFINNAIENLQPLAGHSKDTNTTGTKETITNNSNKTTGNNLQLQIYYNEIWERIRSNWAISDDILEQVKGLEAVIILKILRDGTIDDFWFETKSGNTFFDQSVVRAIKKSSPLPPLSRFTAMEHYEIGIRFKPEEGS